MVIVKELRDDLKRAADAERVDFPAERDRFLGTLHSPHTARLYRRGLDRLETYAASRGVPVVSLTGAIVDDWIGHEQKGRAAAATVRAYTAAGSAWFTWLERRNDTVRNPFRGTRAMPARKSVRTLAVPSAEEVAAMLAAADPTMRAAIVVMSRCGLRVGALPSLTVRGGRWNATSKGKEVNGPCPADVIKALEPLGLRNPFEGLSAGGIAMRFRRLMVKTGGPYSVHDLRHYCAVQAYQEGHDIYAVSRLLNHSGVAVTQTYLRSLALL
jgi:site-specific recombinase XerD